MGSNIEALQVLASEVKKLFQDLLGSAPFDITRKGKIIEVLDSNKYSVNIDGTVYTVPSCVTTGFAVNDTVLVISCQNDAKKNYIIGKSNAIKGESGSTTADMSKSVYDVDGNGIVDNAEKVGGFTVEKSVPSDAVFTDTVYVHPAGTNPHGTTKSDVGLGNVDNTADANKSVLNATKLTTPRTINDVSFDGSANISIVDSTKEPTITGGLVSQFWSGIKTWRDLATDVRAVVLTGLSNATNAVIAETDSILGALGKLQKQISDHIADTVKHITTTERTNWGTAYTNNHTHSNKTVLDSTTAPYTTAEQDKLSNIAPGAEVNVQSDFNATSGDALILNKPTTIAGYGITDAYTKTEVDNKVSAVYRYKGNVANYASLPTSGRVTGDTYNVTDTGINYAWADTFWDDIGGVEALATASNNGLMTKEDFAKLAGIAAEATKNDTDANLKSRANHTGTQSASTISDFSSAALTAAPAETVVSMGTLVNGATTKNTPVDADMIPLMDSADSNKIKKLSWAYVKIVLALVFAPLVHTHTVSSISDLTATVTELNYTDGVTSSIQTQLSAKAPLVSPALTGTPTAPTATSGTNTTQIATTAFVQSAVGASSGGTTIVVSPTQPSSQSVGDFWLAVL